MLKMHIYMASNGAEQSEDPFVDIYTLYFVDMNMNYLGKHHQFLLWSLWMIVLSDGDIKQLIWNQFPFWKINGP